MSIYDQNHPSFFGRMRVLRSRQRQLFEMDVPVREHKKRRNQSAAYHARIQKKWNKRFGLKKSACALVLDGKIRGLSFDTLILDDSNYDAMAYAFGGLKP